MQSIIPSFFDQYQLKPDLLVVGVSTGVDSMVLLSLLNQVIPATSIVVCHINHGQREASQVEEAFIMRYAQEHQMQCFVGHLPLRLEKGNFQEDARRFRLKFFKQVMKQVNARYLFLAHHVNDDMETAIMNMIRGGSLSRLAGMKEYYEEDGIAICRPLLKTSKRKIITYAIDYHIPYYEDASNATDHYTRNWIRHHIVDVLWKEFPEIDQSFLDYKDTLTTASIHLEAMRDNYIQDQVIQTRGKIEWNRGSFLKLDTSLQQEVLFELTKKSRLSKAMIDELRHVIAMDKPNHTMAIKGVCFTKEYDVLSLQKLVKKPNMTSIVLQEMKDYPISEDWMISIHKKRCNCECNSSNIWYNSTMLPLVARCRRDGDEIEFDYGTKKVKRCFIDQKVGQSKRKQPILLEKNGRILAILGVASSKHLPALEDCDIVIELKETKNESESLH